MSHLDRHPLIRMLRALDLPYDDFVVFGSGPLLAHGLRTTLGDLDKQIREEKAAGRTPTVLTEDERIRYGLLAQQIRKGLR